MEYSIKNYAKKAKRRLGSGFWNEIRQERANCIKNAFDNADHIREIYSKKLMHTLYVQQEDDADVVLYKKVCKLLSKDEFTLNPIGQLIDHKTYDKLSSENKQTYIIKLTDKYNEMRERFERERMDIRC